MRDNTLYNKQKNLTFEEAKLLPFPDYDSIMQVPVVCYCSLKQVHTKEHIECKCDGWERARAEGCGAKNPTKYLGQLLFPALAQDEDGYDLCRYCGKIRFKNWLVQCPYCDKYFKGPVPWFNKKFHYECEECG